MDEVCDDEGAEDCDLNTENEDEGADKSATIRGVSRIPGSGEMLVSMANLKVVLHPDGTK